jgi:hypothetical protein
VIHATQETPRTGRLDAAQAARTLRHFIGMRQLLVIVDACHGEERQFFYNKLAELAHITRTMPKVYEQDGLGDRAVAYLHYFTGSCDWYITERDTSDEQHQAFGWADLGCGGELGYISIAELLEAGAELDLHFAPRSLAQIKEGD